MRGKDDIYSQCTGILIWAWYQVGLSGAVPGDPHTDNDFNPDGEGLALGAA